MISEQKNRTVSINHKLEDGANNGTRKSDIKSSIRIVKGDAEIQEKIMHEPANFVHSVLKVFRVHHVQLHDVINAGWIVH